MRQGCFRPVCQYFLPNSGGETPATSRHWNHDCGVGLSTNVEGHQLPSLGSFVRGKDVESGSWVYALSARAVLDDSFASLTLKRGLEAGRVSPADVPPGVLVGRVSVAEKDMAARAREDCARLEARIAALEAKRAK